MELPVLPGKQRALLAGLPRSSIGREPKGDRVPLTRLVGPAEQARAHAGLAASEADGGSGHASRHWRKALDLYAKIGAPEADQIRTRLSARDAEVTQ